jgi:hypothetical protein
MKPLSVFIGFDPVESIAYHVFEHSIQSRSSQPVSVTPLRLSQLDPVLTRPRHPLQSNDFAFSRWLVPWLCGYKGWALFADSDMLCLADITELWALRDDKYAVMVVQHDHRPRETVKYLGNVQTSYERKNWSSVMLFNCARCGELTPAYVNTASGLDLHQFKWLRRGKKIGALPPEWNHLVGYDAPDARAKIAHFTLGGPWWNEFSECEFADVWFEERDRMQFFKAYAPTAATA